MTKKRKRRKVRVFRVILLIILVLLIIIAAGLLWYKNELEPVGSADEEVTIEVSAGESYSSILDTLKEDGLIKSTLAASVYAKLHDTTNVYEGEFTLNKGMNTAEVLNYLTDPANINLSYAVVTIPEGYWAKQIAAVLAEAFPEYTAQDFLDLWNSNEYIDQLAADYDFIDAAALEDDQYFVKLEGYLFPETYYIDYGSTTDEITRYFLNQFGKVYEENIDAFNSMAEQGWSVQDIVTLASIVQFESGDAAEMPDIAEVFYNRLEAGMDLQSSVTVCYALYDDYTSAKDCETQTDIDSPYNTYLYSGLPIGPILNPGADAIYAVLHPAENDYYYFVADIHGDGAVYFATTYEEHEANVERFNLSYADEETE